MNRRIITCELKGPLKISLYWLAYISYSDKNCNDQDPGIEFAKLTNYLIGHLAAADTFHHLKATILGKLLFIIVIISETICIHVIKW